MQLLDILVLSRCLQGIDHIGLSHATYWFNKNGDDNNGGNLVFF